MDRTSSSPYRRDIDGLRAIAVTAVVIFHLFHTAFARGFLGVDIFFVISGYLITGIIWRDIAKDRFSIAVFYQRRIRRLMPALLVVLFATSAVAAAMLLPADLEGYGKSLLASLFFVANIYFWRDTDYFSTAADQKPLLNLWSLGVEEQFYIFFPVLLLLLARRPRVLVPALWFFTIGSLALNIALLKAGGAAPAFYLLPTRAWELGAGALVALHGCAAAGYRFGGTIRALAAVLILGGLFYDGSWPSWLPVSLPVVVGTALLIWTGAPDGSLTGRFLGLAPVNFVGRISYSLYLWHWPLIVLAKYYLIRDLTTVEASAVGLLSVLAATLSWKYVEKPFRTHDIPFRKVAGYSAAGAIGVTAIGAALIATHGLPGRLSPEVASINRSVGTNYRCPVSRLMPLGASRACDLTLDGKDVNSAEVVLLGNSHAQMYAPIVEDILRERNKVGILIPINSCLPTVSVNISSECLRAAETNLEAVRAISSARTVIVALNWPVEHALVGNDGRAIAGDRAEALAAGIRDLAKRLPGRKLLVVGPIAQPGIDIASVLSRQMAFGVRPLAKNSTPAAPFRQKFFPILAGFGGESGVTLIRPDLYQCDRDNCYFVRGSLALFADSNHVAAPALATFKPAFVEALEPSLDADTNGRRVPKIVG